MRKLILLGFFYSAVLYSAVAGADDSVEITLGDTVVGNQEQPKVLYIVPWQAPDGPEGFDRNFDSELKALFEPVERDDFRRHLHLLEQTDERIED